MTQILLAIHVMVAIALVGLILVQHGKGAEMGAGFGAGASATVFGSQGSVSFLLKITAALAAVFFATSILLGNMANRDQKRNSGFVAPPSASQQQLPAAGTNTAGPSSDAKKSTSEPTTGTSNPSEINKKN